MPIGKPRRTPQHIARIDFLLSMVYKLMEEVETELLGIRAEAAPERGARRKQATPGNKRAVGRRGRKKTAAQE